MRKWYMLTVVGRDRKGIVAHVTAALLDAGCNLGEASMMRLGGNFTMMLMLQCDKKEKALALSLEPVVQSLDLHAHIDQIEGHLHQHLIPDVHITVYGADRAGIVAQVTATLADAGLNITGLDSDVAGNEDQPIYIMNIEGVATAGIATLESALEIIVAQGIDATLTPIDTLLG